MRKLLLSPFLICLLFSVAHAAPPYFTHRNLVYATVDGASLQMDIDVPRNQTRPAQGWPVVISIHGGGWQRGDKNATEGGWLPLRGYVRVRPNYRLSGTWKMPAQIHDIKAVIRYVRQHARTYHIDVNHIGLLGNSAGAHLAALTGVSNYDRFTEGEVGTALRSRSDVQAVVAISPPTDFNRINEGQDPTCAGAPEDFTKAGKIFSLLFSNTESLTNFPALTLLASPTEYVTEANAPNITPFLIIHGTRDCAVPHYQSVLLHEKLLGTGLESKLISVEGAGHNISPQAIPYLVNQIDAFFDRHLK